MDLDTTSFDAQLSNTARIGPPAMNPGYLLGAVPAHYNADRAVTAFHVVVQM